jgi:hypothetical protein
LLCESRKQFGSYLHVAQDVLFAHKGYQAVYPDGSMPKGVNSIIRMGHIGIPEVDRVATRESGRKKMKDSTIEMITYVYNLMKKYNKGKTMICLPEMLSIASGYVYNNYSFQKIKSLSGDEEMDSNYYMNQYQQNWNQYWSPASHLMIKEIKMKLFKMLMAILIIALSTHCGVKESQRNNHKENDLNKKNGYFISKYSKKNWIAIHKLIEEPYDNGLIKGRPGSLEAFIMNQNEVFFTADIKLEMLSSEIKDSTAKTLNIVKVRMSKKEPFSTTDTLLCLWVYSKGRWYLRYF